MSKRNQKVGAWGEEKAATYLKENGYTVLERNVHTPYGEIDIIAVKDNFTVIAVEGKPGDTPHITHTENALG